MGLDAAILGQVIQNKVTPILGATPVINVTNSAGIGNTNQWTATIPANGNYLVTASAAFGYANVASWNYQGTLMLRNSANKYIASTSGFITQGGSPSGSTVPSGYGETCVMTLQFTIPLAAGETLLPVATCGGATWGAASFTVCQVS